jgi:hypothetical protein
MPGLAGKGANKRSSWNYLVPGGGVEPPRPEGRRILSPLRLPVPPSRHCWKVLVTDRSHTFSSTRADVILRLRNPLQNPRVPYEILPPLALTARHVVARSSSEGRLLRAEASSIGDLPVVPLRPRHCGAGRVPPVFAFFSTRSFHAVRSAPVSTSSLAGGRRICVCPTFPQPPGFFFLGRRTSSQLSYRSALCGGRHEENLSHLDRRTARFGALARPRQRLVYVSAFQDP